MFSAVNRKFPINIILNKGWFHLLPVKMNYIHRALTLYTIYTENTDHVNTILIHQGAKLFSIENPFRAQRARIGARRLHKLRVLINRQTALSSLPTKELS